MPAIMNAMTHAIIEMDKACFCGILPLTNGFSFRSGDFLSTSISKYSFKTNPKIWYKIPIKNRMKRGEISLCPATKPASNGEVAVAAAV